MKDAISKVSVPGRVIDLLWTDEEYFREVSSSKKVSSSGKFPRCDQWCDEAGLHMAFALAGYSPGDIRVYSYMNQISITGNAPGSHTNNREHTGSIEGDNYPAKEPKKIVQQGMIVRGIARRNFKVKFYINSEFNANNSVAKMRNGLLEIIIPRGESLKSINIDIEEV